MNYLRNLKESLRGNTLVTTANLNSYKFCFDAKNQKFMKHTAIPHICHGHTDNVRGEKSVMWRNFKFLYMKHVEKAKISPHLD